MGYSNHNSSLIGGIVSRVQQRQQHIYTLQGPRAGRAQRQTREQGGFADLFQSSDDRYAHLTYGPRHQQHFHAPVYNRHEQGTVTAGVGGTRRRRRSRGGSQTQARTRSSNVRVNQHPNVRTRRLQNAQRQQHALRSGQSLPASTGGSSVAAHARTWNQRAFKPGQTKRCADWVSTVLSSSGARVRRSESAAGLAAQGQPVSRQGLRPGDAIFFGNTYRRGRYTHVGIYMGDNKFQHRPTSNRPVTVGSLDSGYWATRFTGGRRFM